MHVHIWRNVNDRILKDRINDRMLKDRITTGLLQGPVVILSLRGGEARVVFVLLLSPVFKPRTTFFRGTAMLQSLLLWISLSPSGNPVVKE